VNVCVSIVRSVPPANGVVARTVSMMRQGSRPGFASLRTDVTQSRTLRLVPTIRIDVCPSGQAAVNPPDWPNPRSSILTEPAAFAIATTQTPMVHAAASEDAQRIGTTIARAETCGKIARATARRPARASGNDHRVQLSDAATASRHTLGTKCLTP
jgi:hypothetical protein